MQSNRSIPFFFTLLPSRPRRLHQQEILHQIDCNTGLVVVNLQDPMLDVQVLHLSLESQKIESLVNQHQDLDRPRGQVVVHLYAAVVSILLGSVNYCFLHLSFPAAPLNLANSPSLHLLTDGEKTLCSSLRLLPKPYLVVKETLVREYARRGGKLRRREARDLVKIDVNKLSRVWDFLVQSGYLKITNEQSAVTASSTAPSASQPQGNGCVI